MTSSLNSYWLHVKLVASQRAGRSGNRWSIVNEGIYAPAGGETISHSMAGSKLDRSAQLSCCWRLQKNCSQPTKIARKKKLLTQVAHNSKFIVSKNLLTENQICSWRINFAHGESWIALQSICNLSMDAWHDFYLHTNCSNRRKFAHSKEKLFTKIKFALSKNLLTAEICSQNLLAA